jgi:hypothetical protein
MSDQEASEIPIQDRRASQTTDIEKDSVMPETPDADEGEQSNYFDPAVVLSQVTMFLPPLTLSRILLGVFDAKAWQAMGLIADPMTNEATKDLPAAQLSIDCVQFFLDKVEATFSEEERRDARRRLNDLRMNFLTQSREP